LPRCLEATTSRRTSKTGQKQHRHNATIRDPPCCSPPSPPGALPWFSARLRSSHLFDHARSPGTSPSLKLEYLSINQGSQPVCRHLTPHPPCAGRKRSLPGARRPSRGARTRGRGRLRRAAPPINHGSILKKRTMKEPSSQLFALGVENMKQHARASSSSAPHQGNKGDACSACPRKDLYPNTGRTRGSSGPTSKA